VDFVTGRINAFPMNVVEFAGQGRMEVKTRPTPRPAADEVLLAVKQVGVCGTDAIIFKGGLAQRVSPGRILGHEMFGVVAEPSADGLFKSGDRVVVEPTISCGVCAACQRGLRHVCERLKILGIDTDGALQEFWAVSTNRIHKLPDAISADHATLVEPLAVSVHAVRLAEIKSGERIVVIGGGPIGLMIGLLARRVGGEVLVLEVNPFRQAFARELGFTVRDPSSLSAAELLDGFKNVGGAEVIFEASGSTPGARLLTALAGVHGRLIVVGIQKSDAPFNLYEIFQRELSLQGVRAYTRKDFMEAIRLLAEAELDLTPFITQRYPLAHIQTALESTQSGAGVMKIIIQVS
jgi:(R,R)-butanediol dehydrogenase / meso-butanediol dehydrogenase / diacetyl reductase